ncbi:hypothetical protein BLOT_007102 [Blomia tropicalis]|nr:hypothetical protein BLOT_007102 [Blomia tropicalis]
MGLIAQNGLFVIFFLVALTTVESASNDCDLGNGNQLINITLNDDKFSYLNVWDLNNHTALKTHSSCLWNISSMLGDTLIHASRVVFDPKDQVNVLCFRDNANFSLYSALGSIEPGLISTGTCNTVQVSFKLNPESNLNRTWEVIFYSNPSFVSLTKDNGLLSFPLNQKASSPQNHFSLNPSSDYSDRKVALNFLQLPKSFSFELDGETYNQSKPPAKIYFPSAQSLTFTLKNLTPTEIIRIHFWLVTADCSGDVSLKINEAKPIATPNEDIRKQQMITTVKCAQHFTTGVDGQFQLMIDPNLNGLANPSDTVNFYNDQGAIQLGLNNPSLLYFKTIDNVLAGNSFLVIYDSPYSSKPNPTFKAPIMKAISSKDVTQFYVSNKTMVSIPKSDTKIVHIIYPSDMNTRKRVLVNFGNVNIATGQFSIKIYNSESDSGVLIATLGQYDRLPSVIASNTPFMRVVFEGKIPDLNVTYLLIDSQQCCQHLSTFDSTFEVRGGQSNCSWYIPVSNPNISKYTVVNPTFIELPEGKQLDVITYFTKNGSTKVNSIKGPMKKSFYPDLFLDGENTYEFKIDSSNLKEEDLHVLFAHKTSYLKEIVPLNSLQKVSSLTSNNYPGYYPMGLEQTFTFNEPGKNVFITVEDVSLGDGHSLKLMSQNLNVESFTGKANLTNVHDYFITNQFFITFNTKSFDLPSLSNSGFHINVQYPGIARNYTLVNGRSEIKFNSTEKSLTNPINIWRITEGEMQSPYSNQILHINVTLLEGLDKTKAKLFIYDSISLRSHDIHFANGSINGTIGHFIGSIKSAMIVYDYSESLKTKSDFSINIVVTSESCSNTKNYTTKCHTTDRCITDPMICNGINDCGDFTDEMYCGDHPRPSPPTPTPAPTGGVPTLLVIFLLMPMSAAFGILGYIYLPNIINRWGRGRYSEFRDLSEVS